MQGTILHRHDASPAVLRWLERHDVDHEVRHHRVAFTAAAAAHADHVAGRSFVKVLAVETDDARRALLVLDADDRLDLVRAARALDARAVRLLPEEAVAAIDPLDDVGTLAPIGALYGLPVVADVAIREVPFVAFAGGSHEVAVHADRAQWEAAAAIAYRPIAVPRPAWLGA